MTADLAQFLRARLNDDEQAARAATPGPWAVDSESFAEAISAGDGSVSVVAGGRWGGEASVFETTADAVHIARHDPARVLAEVDAKRALLDDLDYGGSEMADARWHVARRLASVYADHPDYLEEWRP